jgi:hypothetical protein
LPAAAAARGGKILYSRETHRRRRALILLLPFSRNGISLSLVCVFVSVFHTAQYKQSSLSFARSLCVAAFWHCWQIKGHPVIYLSFTLAKRKSLCKAIKLKHIHEIARCDTQKPPLQQRSMTWELVLVRNVWFSMCL